MPELIVPITPVMQPHPVVNEGGDCFACATAAIFNSLFGLNLSVAQAVDLWKDERGYVSNSWPWVEKMCNKAETLYKIEIDKLCYIPIRNLEKKWYGGNWQFLIGVSEYTRMLHTFLSAGFVAISEVRHPPVMGSHNSEGKRNFPNHMVVINGIRQQQTPLPDKDGQISCWRKDHFASMVCSVKGQVWIRIEELIEQHGAGGWWLIRKANEWRLPTI